MRALVMGAGSIGSLFAGFLAKQGWHVAIVARRAHVEAVRARGLRVEGPLSSFTVRVEAYEDASYIKGGFDLVLITVKAYDTGQASLQVKHLVKLGAVPLCLQNGLGVEREASRLLETRVFRAVTNNGALLSEPGLVKHTGAGETVISTGHPALEKFADALNASGLPARVVEDMEGAVWLKTLINAGINPLGALTGLRNGELLEAGWLRELMRRVVEEGWMVASKKGVELSEDPVEAAFRVAKATAGNKNSMLQDLEKGRRTEVDYINGAIAREAEELGIEAPLNKALTLLIKAMEARPWRS
ncbi:MAG: 2-dehydropantoate 2-reductase [Candidatus Nezhaarchaeota archaeon]|nr:2-dehydropantoate 2-reductase [Candidatus Nezhaarchaeota archaeon]